MSKNKYGFSFVELLIVMAILALITLATVMALKPLFLVNKAGDADRKNDLNKLKNVFEEYMNDKGFYPSFIQINNWNTAANCGREVADVKKYISEWLCDPNGKPYTIVADGNWFKVMTNLTNKSDKDIPRNWYTDNGVLYSLSIDRNSVNYGVSSSNILWYEDRVPLSACGGNICLKLNSSGCNDAVGIGCSYPDNCYIGTCSFNFCKTTSCN